MTAFQSLYEAKAWQYTCFICSVLVALISITYTLCTSQDKCVALPEGLAMISDTWVYPPENYLSRWVVGVGCGLFAIVQLFVFWINELGNFGRNKGSSRCGCASVRVGQYVEMSVSRCRALLASFSQNSPCFNTQIRQPSAALFISFRYIISFLGRSNMVRMPTHTDGYAKALSHTLCCPGPSTQ